MSVFEKMTAIADKIRAKLGGTEPMGLDRMAESVDEVYEAGKTAGYTDEHNFMLSIIARTVTELTPEDLKGVTYLGGQAFAWSNLVSIELPNTITGTAASVFLSCYQLKQVKLPYNFPYVEGYLFHDCRNLTEIIIPASVTRCGVSALNIGTADNKATITFLGTTPPSIQSNTFIATKLNKIIVPAGCGDTYKAATNWSAFADYIEEASPYGELIGTGVIGEYAGTDNVTINATTELLSNEIIIVLEDYSEEAQGADGLELYEFDINGCYCAKTTVLSMGVNVIDLYAYFSEEEVDGILQSGVVDMWFYFDYCYSYNYKISVYTREATA